MHPAKLITSLLVMLALARAAGRVIVWPRPWRA